MGTCTGHLFLPKELKTLKKDLSIILCVWDVRCSLIAARQGFGLRELTGSCQRKWEWIEQNIFTLWAALCLQWQWYLSQESCRINAFYINSAFWCIKCMTEQMILLLVPKCWMKLEYEFSSVLQCESVALGQVCWSCWMEYCEFYASLYFYTLEISRHTLCIKIIWCISYGH